MGETAAALDGPDRLLRERGVHAALDAFVVGAAFSRDGAACAFGLGDGTLRIASRGASAEDWRSVEAHDGATLSLAPDAGPGGWISGGDDGAFQRIAADGGVQRVAGLGGKWVEHVASYAADGKSGSVLACAAGKLVHLFGADGTKLKALEHPSTVTGIAFDAKGKRVGASHYNGASVWFVGAKVDSPRRLEWKGSHTGVAIHPGGEALVTTMQENSLHGWWLVEGKGSAQHMRMSGYPAKTESLSFSRNGKWLATSGADAVVLWPFFGGGPQGKAPTELAGGDGVLCTRVACHPRHDAVAAGFNDGLVVLADIENTRILPVCAPGRGPVSALAWSGDGTHLAFGTETGFAAVVDFSKR